MRMIRRLTIAVSCLILSSTSVQAETTDWAVVEGDARTYTRTILLPNGATDIEFPLNAPEPGYVLLGSGGKQQASVTWFDQTNAWLGQGDSRFGLADGIYGRLTRHVGVTGDLNLSLTYWPEMDLTEPNSEWYLAWPIKLYETGQMTLFPKGDVDAFKFTLEQQANVRISFANRAIRPRVRYHSAGDGKLIVDNPRAALPAGDYVVRISVPDMPPELLGQPQSFVLFKEQSAAAAARMNSITGGEFRPGVPWNLGPFTDGHNEIEFTLEAPALLDITVANRGNSVEALFENAAGLTRPVPSHLPPGAHKLILRNQEDNGFPGFVTLHRREITEAIEPNDFVTDATPLGATLTQDFFLEHASPIDWFSFEPRVAGDHFVRVSATGKDRCGDLWSGFAPSGHDDQRYDRTGTGEVQVFGPIQVSEEEIGQTQSFYIACDALIWDTAHALAITAPGSDPASEAPTSDSGSVYVVGVELEDDFRNQLSALADAANVTFLLAEEAEDLSERIEDIVETEEAIEAKVEVAEAAEGFSWWWLLVFITIGGLGFWHFDRRFRPKDAS